MALQRIYDIDGKLLHSGEAGTLKEFVQRIADEHGSLARADLSGLDLSNLKAAGVDFTEACLDRTNMRGSMVKRAVFRRASMHGAILTGASAERADFREADLSEDERGTASRLQGAQLTYSQFDEAILDGAGFDRASMSSTSMVRVRARKASFDGCHMHNVDWTGAELIGSSFRDAKMTSTWKRGLRHVPRKAVGATLAGNDMKGAEIGRDCRDFRRDDMKSRVARATAWHAATLGLFVATSALPFDEGSIMESGMPFLVAGGLLLLKEHIEEIVSDWLREKTHEMFTQARLSVARLARKGRAAASVAVAFATSRQADVLAEAIGQNGRGILERLKAAGRGDTYILVCDRRSLARALSVLSDAAAGVGRGTDIVLLRPGGDDLCPRAVVLRADGAAEVIWARRGSPVVRLRWTKDGNLACDPPGGGWKGMTLDLPEVIGTFAAALERSMGVEPLRVNFRTHKVREGIDGAAVVQRRTDQRLDNPNGPSVLALDGTTLAGRIRRPRKQASADETAESLTLNAP